MVIILKMCNNFQMLCGSNYIYILMCMVITYCECLQCKQMTDRHSIYTCRFLTDARQNNPFLECILLSYILQRIQRPSATRNLFLKKTQISRRVCRMLCLRLAQNLEFELYSNLSLLTLFFLVVNLTKLRFVWER